MNKTYSMSIRVSEEELEKLKKAARLEAYASYSEFVRRTASGNDAKGRYEYTFFFSGRWRFDDR